MRLFPLLSGLLLLCLSLTAAAVDESDLLPIDEAFRLEVRAIDAESVELRWQIAEGYYLYRHRISALADAPMAAGELALPDGKRHVDDFFGEVETYRGELIARLDGARADADGRLALKVRYQGCADVGICYPPHQQLIEVALPIAAGTATSSLPSTGLPSAGASGLPGLPAAPAPVFNPISGQPSLMPATPFNRTVEGATDALPLSEEEAFKFEAIVDSPSQLLLRITPAPGYYVYRDRSRFEVGGDEAVAGAPQWPPGVAHRDEHFGEVIVYFDPVEIPLPLGRRSGEAARVEVIAEFQGCQTEGICYPPMTRTLSLELPAGAVRELPPEQVATSSASVEPMGLGAIVLALLGALAGGLILNLMPCVLPVLSLKAIGLAQSGESAHKARSHALWYTAGVLVSFMALGALALGLRAAGQALGWGFQLQQPLFVGFVAFVMFAVGLSLSGVYTLGGGLAGVGQGLASRTGRAGDFFTGVLAVLVASPCTAPFMGPALAAAFALPAPLALALFAALGLGLALPFLLIGYVPALAARLPRPGAWMETLKNLLAFPMYLTAVWLLWVLGRQRGMDAVGLALVGMVVLAGGLWAFERARYAEAAWKRFAAAAVIALALLPLLAVAWLPAQRTTLVAEEGVEPYSQARLDALQAQGRAVFVNMTADWCVTCKANEARVLGTDAFKDALESADAVYMVGDWTDVDPHITQFLEAHGAVGVPLYVVFGPQQKQGRVLPTVLRMADVESALEQTR